MKHPTLKHATLAIAALLFAGTLSGVHAQEKPAAATLPAWDQLSDAQRQLLVAPLRERWDSRPADRARMLERAQRWQEMTPEQRKRARHGMHRWEKMDPEHRERMRALFSKMRGMDKEERKALRAQWREMTPEQRKAWVEANAPRSDAD